jgi:2-methylcitrate dehydratase PrpD
MQVSGAVGGMSLVWRNRELLAQPPSAYGAIGAAAAVARLRRLDVDQARRAIGLAAMFTAAPAESMRAGTGEYHYLKGLAAAHAHAAAMLAASGAEVSPTALEGPAGFYRIWANIPIAELAAHDVAAELRQRVAEDWVAPELSFKRYPVNYFNQPFIDAARMLKARHSIDPAGIQAIRLRVGAHPAKVGALGAAPFDRRSAAMMSTRFGVACMLARDRVTLADTLEPGGADIRRLSDLAEAEADPRADNVAGLEIVTPHGIFGGDIWQAFSDYRLPADEIRRLSEPLVSERIGTRGAALLTMLENIEEIPTVTELVAATRP